MNKHTQYTAHRKLFRNLWVVFLRMCTLFLLAPFVQNVEAYTAPDLPAEHTFQPMISHLVETGIMNPLADGSFGANLAMSRASAVTAALRAGQYWVGEDYNPAYLPSDVDPNQWYAVPIARARQMGIISNGANFRPIDTVTKAETLAIISKALNVDHYKYSEYTRGIAKDVPAGSWYAGYFAFAKKYRIMHLHGGQYFYPEKPLTRAEFAVYLYRTLRVVNAGADRLQELELEAQMQHFMALVDEGKIEAAQEYIPRILTLSDNLLASRSDADSLAAHTMGLALDDFARALRAYNSGKRLSTVEYLHTASVKLSRVESTGEDMAVLAVQFNGVIEDMIASLYLDNGTMVATQ